MTKNVLIEIENLRNNLPVEINEKILKELWKIFGTENLKKVFRETSILAKILMDNPGSFKMLEIVYTRKALEGAIDRYLLSSLSAQALQNRLVAIISYLTQQITKIMKDGNKKTIKIANLGSGSGRDTIETVKRIIAQNETIFNNSVLIDCVDIDPEALTCAKMLAQEKGVSSNLKFINSNLISCQYRQELDLGLLIGILCGLKHRECITILKRIKKYFKKGGILIASNVTTKMPEAEPFFSQIVIREIIGWKLVYKNTEELEEIFKEAGYEWLEVFYDEPWQFHAIGVGQVLLD